MKNIGNVFIVGDSYSTFKGYVAEGCAVWYSPEGSPNTDVTRVEETWWHQLLKNTESNLVLNHSYSGSTFCFTGYGGEDCSKAKSFIARIRDLENDGFFKKNKIDTFFIFGGTNDTWVPSPLGEINFGDKTEQDLYSVFPAVCYLFEKIKKLCPHSRIIAIQNDTIKPEIKDCLKTVCKHFSIELIVLEQIEKQAGHPNIAGMKQIFEQVLEKL